MLISMVVPFLAIVSVFLFKLPMHWLLLVLPVPFTTIPANIYGRIAMRRIRRAPIVCNECGASMHLQSEKKEDAFLKMSQQFEEELHSADYDVLCAIAARTRQFLCSISQVLTVNVRVAIQRRLF
jgi:hypothetical protein